MRSGSASRTATSVIAVERKRRSSLRQTSRARNQKRAIGPATVAKAIRVAGRPMASKKPVASPSSRVMKAQAKAMLMAAHTPLAAAAMMNGLFEGRSLRA